ncbi:hypothetical protein CTI14_28570 [Methylobacterium radiotolerans]|nr:hypothetical protein CTI14_28570 [Methylobacterium radiotolerans]
MGGQDSPPPPPAGPGREPPSGPARTSSGPPGRPGRDGAAHCRHGQHPVQRRRFRAVTQPAERRVKDPGRAEPRVNSSGRRPAVTSANTSRVTCSETPVIPRLTS